MKTIKQFNNSFFNAKKSIANNEILKHKLILKISEKYKRVIQYLFLIIIYFINLL